MGQCYNAPIPVTRTPKVWNEGEDFGGNLADWCEHVFPNANQAEDFERVSLESVDLKHITYQLQSTGALR